MTEVLPESCKKATVLIVDDISFYGSLIEQTLKNNGFQGTILQANSLKKAAEVIQKCLHEKNTVDLLITDLNLPDGKATVLIKKIRQTKALENMAIVLVTTNEEAKNVIEAFEAGVDNYVFKPIEDRNLFEKIVFSWKKHHPN